MDGMDASTVSEGELLGDGLRLVSDIGPLRLNGGACRQQPFGTQRLDWLQCLLNRPLDSIDGVEKPADGFGLALQLLEPTRG